MTPSWLISQEQPVAEGAKPDAQQVVAQDPAAAIKAVRERVTAYYDAITRSDRVSAEKLVAPDSKQDYYRMQYETLLQAKVTDVQLAETADSAVVTTTRTYRLNVPQLLDMDFKETWKLIDGEWYLVLPNMKQQETPFGPMSFPGKVDQVAVQKMIEERNKHADPDQYQKALERVNRAEAARQQQINEAHAKQEAEAKAAADAAAAKDENKKKKSKKPAEDSRKPAQETAKPAQNSSN